MAERGAVFLGEVVIANCFAAQCEAWGLFSEERGIFGVDEDALDDAWCEFAGSAFVDEGAIGTEDDLVLSRVALMRLFEGVAEKIKKAHKREGRA